MKLLLLSILLAFAMRGAAHGASAAGSSRAPADTLADTLAEPAAYDQASAWDGRPRMQVGVAHVHLSDETGGVYPIFLSLNYRLSWNADAERSDALRLGAGGEAGIFYLYPYLLLGPELRYRDLYLEAHGGATFIFLVGSDTPDGTGAAIGGGSLGWIVGGDEIKLEIQGGADVIKLLKGKRSTAFMPHVTVAMRF
jgi:hypothetical protein